MTLKIVGSGRISGQPKKCRVGFRVRNPDPIRTLIPLSGRNPPLALGGLTPEQKALIDSASSGLASSSTGHRRAICSPQKRRSGRSGRKRQLVPVQSTRGLDTTFPADHPLDSDGNPVWKAGDQYDVDYLIGQRLERDVSLLFFILLCCFPSIWNIILWSDIFPDTIEIQYILDFIIFSKYLETLFRGQTYLQVLGNLENF